MKRKLSKLLLWLSVLIIGLNSNAQETDSLEKFIPKVVEGYFILVRDSIPKTDIDVTLPVREFKILLVKSINEDILACLKVNGLTSTDSLVFISGGTNYAIGKSVEHRQYINWLIKNHYFERADQNNSPFDLNQIPICLINSKGRFASIYKGKCTVVGAFYPYNKINIENQKLYMYLPLENNSMKYLYSVVL